MTDYNRIYRDCESACGEPFPAFVDFFTAARHPLSVLDLGCGQGRDALMAARLGHRVHGVDSAASGIEQMLSRAKEEALRVTAEVADIQTVTLTDRFDTVVLDRVLYMLATDGDREAVLAKSKAPLRKGGHLLIADTRANRALIENFLSNEDWQTTLREKDIVFARLTNQT